MTVRIENLKVGMKVKLVDEVPLGSLIHPLMKKYFGKVCTVRSIDITGNGFEIQEDKTEFCDGGFYWDDILIEKIVDDKERKNKVYTSLEEFGEQISLEDWYALNHYYLYGTSQMFRFEKCIVNNSCVIGIFKGGKRIYKGIARCHPDDRFDLAKGLTIAMLRAYNEYLKRKIKSLY